MDYKAFSLGLVTIQKKWICKYLTIVIVLNFTFHQIFPQEKVLRFKHLTTDDGLSQNTIFGIVKDKYGFVWFGTWGGLNRFDGYKFTIYSADADNPKALPANRIISVISDSGQNIWAMTRDSIIVRYNYDTDDFTRFYKNNLSKAFLDQFFSSYRKVKSKSYEWKWVFNTIVQTNLQTNATHTYVNDPFDKWSVHIDNTIWLYLDNNQILWSGSYYNGICYADLIQKPFKKITTTIKDKSENIILDNKVRTINIDNFGNLWIGTSESGITRYNPKTKDITHFQYDYKDSSLGNRNFYLNHIRSILCDKDGAIWIGTGAGIRRYDPDTKKIAYYWLEPEANETNIQVRSIIEDSKGDLWICSRNSIQKYDRAKNKFIRFKPLNSMGFENPKYRIMIEDRNKNFWVTTELAGLVCLKRETSGEKERLTPVLYKYSATNKNSIGDDFVYHVMEDENGIIWVGTSSGISSFDPQKERFTRINKASGLADETILGILSDRKGHIWVSHTKGISRIKQNDFSIRNYSSDDGLISNHAMENACYRDDNTGILYFGSLNGLIYFHPDSIKDNPYEPVIAFTELKINNQPVKVNEKVNGRVVLSKPIWQTNEITLKHADNDFSIEFAALHYSNPKKNKYAYKLEGFDKNWVYTDASLRVAKYSNLAAKTYYFKVIGSNNDDIWNTSGASLKITVLAPWWKTLWFRTILITLVILLLYLAYNIRIAIYRNRQKELAQLVKNRTEELEKTNKNLKESWIRIEEYAREVTDQSEKLKTINNQLMEKQAQIVEQSEELQVHTENLKEANDLLIEKQKLIEAQTEIMRETNVELTKLNSTKDKLFSIIAHDLKNPFNSIIGFSELLMHKIDQLPVDKTKKYLGLIYSVSSSGYELLDNLLQWSRSQTGRIIFDPVFLSPAKIVEDVLNLLEGHAQSKNISFQQLIDPDFILYADENMLKTIFRNLISNAVKFSYQNSKIIISVTFSENTAEISIKDFGVGISEENLKQLFDVGSNIVTKGTSNETGTGLGLIICKEFVERHHGKIWVESEEGKGSIFKFTIPIKNFG
jgi:signal transduction histidine kinase/ligand-binding sensor domain-containing protein